jgi:hypothetical protein
MRTKSRPENTKERHYFVDSHRSKLTENTSSGKNQSHAFLWYDTGHKENEKNRGYAEGQQGDLIRLKIVGWYNDGQTDGYTDRKAIS